MSTYSLEHLIGIHLNHAMHRYEKLHRESSIESFKSVLMIDLAHSLNYIFKSCLFLHVQLYSSIRNPYRLSD